MADKFRFGLLGCGQIGALHVRAMRRVAEVEVVAVADAVPEYARAFAARYELDAHESYASLLERDDIDAISICTPSGFHARQGCLAALAGKHVLCEKPLDLHVENIDRLIAACRQAGVTLGSIFQNRFPAPIRRVKALLEAGCLGDITFAEASCLWYRPQSYYDSSAWRGTMEIDGGVLANQCIHTIDRLIWLTGMQPAVLAADCPTLQRTMEAEDLGVALLKFPNGASGTLAGTTLAYPGYPTHVTICGSQGSVTIEHNTQITFRCDAVPAEEFQQPTEHCSGGASDPMAIPDEDHAANIADFVQAVRTGSEPEISGAEARKAVQLLNDIYAAAGLAPWVKKRELVPE